MWRLRVVSLRLEEIMGRALCVVWWSVIVKVALRRFLVFGVGGGVFR